VEVIFSSSNGPYFGPSQDKITTLLWLSSRHSSFFSNWADLANRTRARDSQGEEKIMVEVWEDRCLVMVNIIRLALGSRLSGIFQID